MALSKLDADSIDLADDYAFTGTVTGAGEITASTTAPSEGGAATTNVVQGLAKAFIINDGDTTIGDSFNISTLSDNGNGDQTYTYSNNFSSANHVATGTGKSDDNGGLRMATMQFIANNPSNATSFVRMMTMYDNTNARECEFVCAVMHGDLA